MPLKVTRFLDREGTIIVSNRKIITSVKMHSKPVVKVTIEVETIA